MKYIFLLFVLNVYLTGVHAQDSATIYYQLGQQQYKDKQYEKAVASFTKSITIQPSDSAYWQRGKCYRGDDSHLKAIADFDTAIKLNPDNAETHIDRGIRKGALGDIKGAIADYDMAIKLNPVLPSAYWLKAMMYGNDKQRKYDKAIEILTQGVAVIPDDGNMYKYRGDAYKSMGNYKAAIDDFTKALSLKATFTELIFESRAECRTALGDKKGACADMFEAVKRDYTIAKEIFLKECK